MRSHKCFLLITVVFLAFHPKALNDELIRQVFWLVLSPADLPARVDSGLKFAGMEMALTATGIAPDFHRTSLLMIRQVADQPYRCKGRKRRGNEKI
jgi:hypothetical protein